MTEPMFRSQRERDAREMEAIRRQRLVTIKAVALTLAIVMAPFLALLYSLNLALGVLALALGFTTWLTLHATSVAGAAYRSRLRAAAALNAAMMLATLAILVLRLTS
jgi:hypothetical protein